MAKHNRSWGSKSTGIGGKEGVDGAGFFKVCDGEVEVYGRSQSLDVDSREVDAKLICRALGLTPPG